MRPVIHRKGMGVPRSLRLAAAAERQDRGRRAGQRQGLHPHRGHRQVRPADRGRADSGRLRGRHDQRQGEVDELGRRQENPGRRLLRGAVHLHAAEGQGPDHGAHALGALACGTASHAVEGATTKRKKRRLWGSGKGKFRTKGKNASATVRGTIWLTQDTCTTTLVHVKRGVVDVFDFTKHKHVFVKAGRSYVAHAR